MNSMEDFKWRDGARRAGRESRTELVFDEPAKPSRPGSAIRGPMGFDEPGRRGRPLTVDTAEMSRRPKFETGFFVLKTQLSLAGMFENLRTG